MMAGLRPPAVSVPLTRAQGTGAMSLIVKASRPLSHYRLLGVPTFSPLLSTREEHDWSVLSGL